MIRDPQAFGEMLAKTRKKLEEAQNTIGLTERRTRAMARQLRGVEALPDPRVRDLFQRDELPEGDAPGS